MPVGCEFTCKNVNCDNNNKGFVIVGNWPIADIHLLISSSALINKKNIKEELIEYKNQGKKYACIIYPNHGEIKPIGVRVNMWSPHALCIWNYDILFKEGEEINTLINAEVPKACPKSGGRLMTFNQVTEEGIECPSCSQKMYQNRWFTNED